MLSLKAMATQISLGASLIGSKTGKINQSRSTYPDFFITIGFV